MTRASLLHILDHVNGISDAEVRELEQLAGAFPYCQTAHILLAKAAHDRGSMLASQRLRRAATYAADRELLRQLLEQPAAPAAEFAPQPDLGATPAQHAVATVAAAIPAVSALATPPLGGTEATEIPVEETLLVAPEAETEPTAAPSAEEAKSAAVFEQAEVATSTNSATEALDLPPADEPQTALTEEQPGDEPLTHALAPPAEVTLPLLPREEFETATPEAPVSAVQEADAETDAEAATPTEPTETPVQLAATDDLGSEDTADPNTPATSAAEVAEEAPENQPDELLPAVAPPIRPPAEAGISRFEFGLSQAALPAPSSYQLPGLDEDELPELPETEQAPAPLVTVPFYADEDLGYALGAGSRLGYDLQPHDGYTLDLPLDAFFEPDALLLAHLAANKPKPKATSLDLINRFLKNQPRIKSPAGVPLPAEEQTDLSVRSAAVAPALASESLAKIMVRQGKKDKAIEIYERLIERQPEKKAYFAEQIQQLQQPSE